MSHAFNFLFLFFPFFFDFCKIELFSKALSNLVDSSEFELLQVRVFTLNSQLARFSKKTFKHTTQKLHFPCCFCKQRQPRDDSAPLMFWFLRCHRFISPPRCNGTLNQEDSFWSQALQDLETCGQSEILRELEVGLHVTPPPPAPVSSRPPSALSYSCIHRPVSA